MELVWDWFLCFVDGRKYFWLGDLIVGVCSWGWGEFMLSGVWIYLGCLIFLYKL